MAADETFCWRRADIVAPVRRSPSGGAARVSSRQRDLQLSLRPRPAAARAGRLAVLENHDNRGRTLKTNDPHTKKSNRCFLTKEFGPPPSCSRSPSCHDCPRKPSPRLFASTIWGWIIKHSGGPHPMFVIFRACRAARWLRSPRPQSDCVDTLLDLSASVNAPSTCRSISSASATGFPARRTL
jgi:hypothetical protein